MISIPLLVLTMIVGGAARIFHWEHADLLCSIGIAAEVLLSIVVVSVLVKVLVVNGKR